MKVDILAGRYILAVSGGVDSMTLLDILSKNENLELVVAHFNHGIRDDSAIDEEFVRKKTDFYRLPFEVGYGKLGASSGEAEARRARYAFLTILRQKHEAAGIITAHHQDDLIETALINIIRGTGPKGLVAISTNKNVLRPLLTYPKQEILNYSQIHSLKWVEDSTNTDNSYLRNYIRNVLIPKLNSRDRQQILMQIKAIESVHHETKTIIAKISQKILVDELTLDRSAFISLPSEVANSFLVFWFSNLKTGSLDKKTIFRLANSLKTAPAGSHHEVKNGKYLKLSKTEARFTG